MRKNLLNLKRLVLAAIFAVIGVGQSYAADIDYYFYGELKCLIQNGSAWDVNTEAGLVYVSNVELTSESEINAAVGYHASPITMATGTSGSAAWLPYIYYYMKANTGYEFVGYKTSSTGSAPSGSALAEKLTKVGDYYVYKVKPSTPWSANTEATAKVKTIYAVYNKVASADEEPTGTDGAAFKEATPLSLVQGSANNFYIDVYFDKDVAADISSSTYGVNDENVKYATVKDAQGNVVKDVKYYSSATRESVVNDDDIVTGYIYKDGHGRIAIPGTVAMGKYSVHLPYSLFSTTDNGVTAACDFTFEVTADVTPIALVSSTPANGGTWNMDASSTENEDYDGEALIITLTFDKNIAEIVEGKTISLKKGTREFQYVKYGKPALSSTTAAKQLVITYDKLPNGEYTATIPAGIVKGANGVDNEEIVINFTITGSKIDEWALPTYTTVTPSPANNSTVRSATTIEWTLEREGYNAPVGIIAGKNTSATATLITTTFDPTNDNPEYTGDQKSTEISGIKLSVSNGKLVATFAQPVAEEGKLVVNIPAGVINNLPMVISDMTAEEIYNEGGCTNDAISLTLNISPVEIKVARVTNSVSLTSDLAKDENGNYTMEKDKYGNYAKTYTWFDLVDAKMDAALVEVDGGDPDAAKHMLKTFYVWFEEDLQTKYDKYGKPENITYSTDGIKITNISNGIELNVASVMCKTGNSGDGHKFDVLEVKLSSDSWIDSAEEDQGEYEVVLPAGLATTMDGMKTEAYTFHFTYGDPSKAITPEEINLDDYLGDYRQRVDNGEIVDGELETFSFVKVEDKYYITDLQGTDIMIEVVKKGNYYYATAIKEGDTQFGTYRSLNDVEVIFSTQGNNTYIYVDQYNVINTVSIIGGAMYYEKYDKTTNGIRDINTVAGSNAMYNIAGQRVNNAKGIVIMNGKKYVVK